MIDPKIFDDMAKKFSESLPPGMRDMQKEWEKSFKTFMQGAFTKLDLVTREEFDVQAKVLARTREKLAALEKQLAELEKKV